jgi:hypothetical protein
MDASQKRKGQPSFWTAALVDIDSNHLLEGDVAGVYCLLILAETIVLAIAIAKRLGRAGRQL